MPRVRMPRVRMSTALSEDEEDDEEQTIDSVPAPRSPTWNFNQFFRFAMNKLRTMDGGRGYIDQEAYKILHQADWKHIEQVRQIFCAVTSKERRMELTYNYFAEDHGGTETVQERNQGVLMYKIMESGLRDFGAVRDILFLCLLLANAKGSQKETRQKFLVDLLESFYAKSRALPRNCKLDFEKKVAAVLSCPISKAEIYLDLLDLKPRNIPSVTKWSDALHQGSVLCPEKRGTQFTNVEHLFTTWCNTFQKMNCSFPVYPRLEREGEQRCSDAPTENNFSSTLYQNYYDTLQCCYEETYYSCVPPALDADVNALLLQFRW